MVRGDVSNMADLDHLIAEIREVHGRIDILFSNVGVAHFEPLGYITEESFDQLFGAMLRVWTADTASAASTHCWE